jgi:hypothetical protein
MPLRRQPRRELIGRRWWFFSGLPCRLLGLVVVDDDVGEIGRADRVEVVLLRGQVAGVEAFLGSISSGRRRNTPSNGSADGG